MYEPGGVSGRVRDDGIFEMAEQRPAEQTAWEGEMFRLLAENVKDYAIFIVDPHRHILSWSKGAERLLGFSEQEILGQRCDCFFTPEDVQRRSPEGAGRLATGRGEDDRWHLRKDGSRFWAAGVVTPLKDAGRALGGFAKIMRDRTEMRARCGIGLRTRTAPATADRSRPRSDRPL